MTKNYLRGKIVRILDNQRVIVNLGYEQGVTPGSHFFIYEEGEEIFDPSSNASLGKLELIKAELETYNVQEKMSVLTPRQREGSQSTTVLSATLAQTSSTHGGVSRSERNHLNVRQDQISGFQSPSVIALGDLVRSVSPVEK